MGRSSMPYKVVCAFDTETTNVVGDFSTSAFTTLYQVGELFCELEEVFPQNVENVVDVSLYRDQDAAFEHILDIARRATGYVPVCAVHNLGFDMHAIARKLLACDVKVLAKTPQKPISFTLIGEDKRPFLVIWDTLGFSGMGLEKMGRACGYTKAVGDWDYERVRAPQTRLDEDEERYAKRDIYALFSWLAWYTRRNPDIPQTEFARRVSTKTGAVRMRRLAALGGLRGRGHKKTVEEHWHALNQMEKPKTDDELYTMQACTRGGFTFVAREYAGLPIEGRKVLAYDATSMHPAQMVSHSVPVGFREATPELLALDMELVANVTPDDVLADFCQPFSVAFLCEIEFTRLRPRPGSVFARDGIFPLASARIKGRTRPSDAREEAESVRESIGYKDHVEGGVFRFGKLESADIASLYLTELGYWEMCQAYMWDRAIPIHGYETACFARPSDLSVLSVMLFYGRKNDIKHVRALYTSGDYVQAGELAGSCLPAYLVQKITCGEDCAEDLGEYYQRSKADLNSLFGIESTNEARPDMGLEPRGIVYCGDEGIDALSKNPKAHYQYGQRIVGWSRIAQCLLIIGLGKHARIINGDTDSIKLLPDAGFSPDGFLGKYAKAVDKARGHICERVYRCFPKNVRPLDGIGRYELEAVYSRFYAAWNKAYLYSLSDEPRYHITLAGVPADRRDETGGSLEDFAEDLERQGMPFGKVAGLVLGYNVTLASELSHLKGRSIPDFASTWRGSLTDWRGDMWDVEAPAAVGLAPMPKTIGGFDNRGNRIDSEIAARHGFANTMPKLLCWDGKRAEVMEL